MKVSVYVWLVLLTLACGPELPSQTQYGHLPDIDSKPVRWTVEGVYPSDGAHIHRSTHIAVRLLGEYATTVTVKLSLPSTGTEVECSQDSEIATSAEVTRTYTRYSCPLSDFLLLDGWNDFELQVFDTERSESYPRSFYFDASAVPLAIMWDGVSELSWSTEPAARVYLRINKVRIGLGAGSGKAVVDSALIPADAQVQLEAWRHDGNYSAQDLQ